MHKICGRCKIDQPLENYSNGNGRFGKSTACRSCRAEQNKALREIRKEQNSAYRKAWEEEHKEARQAYFREYKEKFPEKLKAAKSKWKSSNKDAVNASTHKRRSLLKESAENYTAEEWQNLCKDYEYACLACGCSDLCLTVDHVVPISKFGSNSIDNIQPLCQPCNSRKNNQTIDYRLNWAERIRAEHVFSNNQSDLNLC